MAADSRGIKAGRAYVELGVSDQLTKGLKAAEKQLKAFGGGLKTIGKYMAGIGTGVATFLGGASAVFAESGKSLLEMSKRTGISVESLSELGYAAKLTGVDVGELEVGVKKMQRVIGDAETGSSAAADTLKKLGVSVADVLKLSPEDQFKLIADRISGIIDPTVRAAMALAVFGRSGTAMLPLIEGGSRAMEKMRAEARAGGLVMSRGDAELADNLGDSLDALSKTGKRLYEVIGSALAPTFTGLTNTLTRNIKAAMNWVSANRGVVVTVLKIAAGVAALGAGLYIAGAVITGIIATVTAFGAAVSGVVAFVGALGSIVVGIATSFGGLAIPVIAAGVALFKFTGYGANAMRWLRDRFADALKEIYEIWGGISDAMSAGDLGLAAEVAWLGVKVAWERGIQAIKAMWLDYKTWSNNIMEEVWTYVADKALYAFNKIEVAWLKTVGAMKDAKDSGLSPEASLAAKAGMSSAPIWAATKLAWQAVVDSNKKMVEGAGRSASRILLGEKQPEAQATQQVKPEPSVDEAIKAAEQKYEDAKKLNEKERADNLANNEQIAENNKPTGDTPELIAARAALDAAKEKAREAANRARLEQNNRAPRSPETGYSRAAYEQDRLDQIAQMTKDKLSTVGTFNVSAAFGLAGYGGAAERTAKATEETSTRIEQLKRVIENNILIPAF